jgi:hypothetical protein
VHGTRARLAHAPTPPLLLRALLPTARTRQGIVFADQAGRAAYHLTAPHVLPLVDRALGAADALGKEYLGRDLHLLHSARSIWS